MKLYKRKITAARSERHWLSTELDARMSFKLKDYLRDRGIKFETSGVGKLTHFEIYVDRDEADSINDFIDSIDISGPSTQY